jgi:hypothetical protein
MFFICGMKNAHSSTYRLVPVLIPFQYTYPSLSRVRNSRFCILFRRPKHKNTSLGPLGGEKHQNCSTARTDLRTIPHGVQEVVVGGGGGLFPSLSSCREKEKHQKNNKTLFYGWRSVRIYSFLTGNLGT